MYAVCTRRVFRKTAFALQVLVCALRLVFSAFGLGCYRFSVLGLLWVPTVPMGSPFGVHACINQAYMHVARSVVLVIFHVTVPVCINAVIGALAIVVIHIYVCSCM